MKQVNATHYEDIPSFAGKGERKDNQVNAIVETPKNSPHKYALNNEYGIIAYHEMLPDSMHWPVDYGFVPQTLAPDGDPLDIVVITDNGLFPGCMIPVRVLGAVHLIKEGVENDRLIAVPLPSEGAPAPSDAYRDISDVPQSQLDRIVTFLVEYSRRQGHELENRGLMPAEEAMRLVKRTGKAFKKKNG